MDYLLFGVYHPHATVATVLAADRRIGGSRENLGLPAGNWAAGQPVLSSPTLVRFRRSLAP